MRTIDRSSVFKRDYKRESKGRHRASLDIELSTVLDRLLSGDPLDSRQHDHELSGDWAGYRECHIKPDLLLIYRKSAPVLSAWPGLAPTVNCSAETATRPA